MKTKSFIAAALCVVGIAAGAAQKGTEVSDGIVWSYEFENGQAVICAESGGWGDSAIPPETPGEITIPSMLGGNTVVGIGDHAFYNCTHLTAVTIPASITKIGEYAFYNTYQLESLTVPASVTAIDDEAFAGVYMTSIDVDPANSHYASDDGMLHDKGKTRLIRCPGGKVGVASVSSNVTDVADNAFYMCDALTAIEVDANNNAYASEDGILYDKAREKIIRCPGGRTAAVAVSEGVTDVADHAFSYCYYLEEVSLPASVTNVGGSAFLCCLGLKVLALHSAVPPALDADSGLADLVGVTVVVPQGAGPAYAAADGWKALNLVEMCGPARKVADQLYAVDYEWYDFALAERIAELVAVDDPLKDRTAGYTNNHRRGIRCLAVRKDGLVGRNLDAALADADEHVVRTSAAYGRLHATLAVANEGFFRMATAHSFTDSERTALLPVFIDDGINDAGLVVSANSIVSGSAGVTEDTNPDGNWLVQPLVTRYLLDYAGSAAEALEILTNCSTRALWKNRESECHWMIADPNETYVVECVSNRIVALKVPQGKAAAMTNYLLARSPHSGDFEALVGGDLVSTEHTPYARGIERYEAATNALATVDGADAMMELLQGQCYSQVYADGRERDFWSEANGEMVELSQPGGVLGNYHTFTVSDGTEYDDARMSFFANERAKEENKRKKTVHSAVYDIAAKSVRLCVQENYETDFTFTFVKADAEVCAANGSTRQYVTISEALASLEGGETVRILKDGVCGDALIVQKTMTLDICGHTPFDPTADAAITVSDGAVLTFTDSEWLDGLIARSLTVNGGSFRTNGGEISVSNLTINATGGNVFIGASTILTTGDMTVMAKDDIYLSEGSFVLVGGVDLEDLSFASGLEIPTILTFSDIVFDARGDITFEAAAMVGATRDVRLTAENGTVRSDAALLAAYNNLNIKSKDIIVTGTSASFMSDILATYVYNEANFDASRNIVFADNAKMHTGGNSYFAAGGDVSVTNGGYIGSMRTIYVGSDTDPVGGTVTVDDGVLDGDEGVSVVAVGDIRGIGRIRADYDDTIRMTSINGSVTFRQAVDGSKDTPWKVGTTGHEAEVKAWTNGVGGLTVEGSGAIGSMPWAENPAGIIELVKDRAVAGFSDIVNSLPDLATVNGLTLDELAVAGMVGAVKAGFSTIAVDPTTQVATLDVVIGRSDSLGEMAEWKPVSTNEVTVPAPGEQGFFIVVPSVPSDAPHSPIFIPEIVGE